MRREEQELCLQADQPQRLERANGIIVRCVSGTVWLTQEGRADDVFFSAGEFYAIESNGLVLLEALGVDGACVHITPSTCPENRMDKRFTEVPPGEALFTPFSSHHA